MKKLFSEIPYIEGERIVLRKITQDDAAPEDWGYEEPLPTDKWIR